MKWASWVSCAHGRCLTKSPFEKKNPCFYRSKKWQYLNSLAREWLLDTIPPVGRSLGTLALSLPTSSSGCRAGDGEKLSRIWPAERYLHLPLGPCCEPPVNDHRTGQISPTHVCWLCATTLSKDASKEAQTGSRGSLWHRTVGQALCKGSLLTLKKVALHYQAWRNARKNRSWSLKETAVFWI